MFRACKCVFVVGLFFASIPIEVSAGGSIPDIRQNNWVHPVVYQSNETCTQFRQYDGHVGSDLCRSVGTSVMAVADGCVEDYNDSLAGYGGTNGERGGAILLRHMTESGQSIYAVYGHITFNAGYLSAKRCTGGSETVKKGDEIGRVAMYIGGSNHLHFGIRPNTPEEAPYQFRGNKCEASDNCGWVDPFKFLMDNRPLQSICNPWAERCLIMSYESVGWYPPIDDCRRATQWFILQDGSDGKYPIGTGTVVSCNMIPAACYYK